MKTRLRSSLLLLFFLLAGISGGLGHEVRTENEGHALVDQNGGLQVKVFPNPFADRVSISSNNTIDHYRLYNILGTLVREGKSQANQLELDTSRLSSGIYMLEVQSGNLRTTLKIVRR